MFCPNCGAQNDDAANICTKCGFTLKQASAPKFKGTMLMMNAPPAVPRPGATPTGPGAGAAAPAGPPSPAAQPGPAGASPGGSAGAGQFAPKPKLKGTMIGVAPPSPGAPEPNYGQPPPGPAGAPAPTAPMAAIPEQNPEAAPAQPGHRGVNPLGGTMVADASAMGGFGGPSPAQPAGAPMQQPAPPQAQPQPSFNQNGGIGQAPPGFGGGDPAYGGGAPGGFAPPPQAQAYPPPGQQPSAPPGGAMMAPRIGHIGAPGAQMVPQQQQPYYGNQEPVPGTVGAGNPMVNVLLIVLTCGIYGIYMLMKNKKA